MAQVFSSANTSINSKKLPAIYKKLDFSKIAWRCSCGVLDYGCGKYTKHIEDFLDSEWGVEFFGYDPYNREDYKNLSAYTALHNGWVDCIICSNVLNVIDDNDAVKDIADWILNRNLPYFITVYEGNGTGVGKQTGKDQYQRNQKVQEYLKYFPDAIVRHGVITNYPEAVF